MFPVCTSRPSQAFSRFALVGLGGLIVQTAILGALTELTNLDYRVVTIIAVEAAVLHNFVWHERWTWRVRDGGHGRLIRALRFHVATATLSIVGNVALMWLLVERFEWPLLAANLAAVAMLGAANFHASDAWVFRARQPVTLQRGAMTKILAGGYRQILRR